MCSSHSGPVRIWSSQVAEMFQSSWTSWSSKIIAVETVDSSHRIGGSHQDSTVEVRVLLEVEHVLAGGPVRGAPLADELLGPGRGLVGVDLVAEHQQQVGPVVERLVEHPLGQAAQRVDLAALGVLVLGQVVGRLVGGGHAAGAEHHLQRLLLRVGPEAAGRVLGVRLGPDLVAVEVDLVLVDLVPGSARRCERARSGGRRRGRSGPSRRAPRPRTAESVSTQMWAHSCPT